MSSTFAVGGLASGLDTSSIIAQLMALEERPLNQIKARQTAHTSKMAAVKSIKDQIASFQAAVRSLADRSKMNAKSAVTDTPSTSPAVLTASATADAINGSFKVTVSQIATATRVTSAGPMGTVIDANAPLTSAGFRYTPTAGNFRINGTSIAVTESMSLNDLVSAINSSGAGVTASLVADADGRANNRVQITSAPGQPLQLGSLSDTSNALRLLNLSDATITGDAATGYTVTSSTNLGVASVGASLTNARLATPIAGLDGSGNGTFKINDVEISYRETDSITTIVNRINASSAGVSAFYDPVQDRLRLSASKTGASTMTLEDTQGNFLAATGVLGATQQLGQNALFSIDAVNNGAQLSSATNNVSGYIPGVTLDLKSASATPVTVTVSQDTETASTSIKAFVTQFNNTLQKIEDLTKYDAETKKASALTGDSGIRDIHRQLRQMVSASAVGATGTYRTLASIGVSFGETGSAVGSTNRLIVDEAKLSKALTENPQAVETVLAGFGATLGTPSTGNVMAAVSGTPEIHQNGEYRIKVTDAATGTVEAKFVTTDGRTLWTAERTIVPGQESYTVIPGLKITGAATLVDGAEDTFSVSVTNKGIGVALQDYVDNLVAVDGYFDERKSGDDSITKSYDKRIADMQARLERRHASLEKKYATLETTMARLQNQSNALMSQLAQLNTAQVS